MQALKWRYGVVIIDAEQWALLKLIYVLHSRQMVIIPVIIVAINIIKPLQPVLADAHIYHRKMVIMLKLPRVKTKWPRLSVFQILYAPLQDVQALLVGIMAILRRALNTLLVIVMEIHITQITFSKEVHSFSFLNKIAALVEKMITIRPILRYRALSTTYALICQHKMELLKSSHIVNL